MTSYDNYDLEALYVYRSGSHHWQCMCGLGTMWADQLQRLGSTAVVLSDNLAARR